MLHCMKSMQPFRILSSYLIFFVMPLFLFIYFYYATVPFNRKTLHINSSLRQIYFRAFQTFSICLKLLHYDV